jgi:hypothetical protein
MLGKKNADTKMSTLIGAGAELTGDFTLDGSARIDGKIGGNVTVTGNLILGAGSIVTGDVQAASVLIGGEVTGNITAPEKAELTASAKVLEFLSSPPSLLSVKSSDFLSFLPLPLPSELLRWLPWHSCVLPGPLWPFWLYLFCQELSGSYRFFPGIRHVHQ